MEANALLNAISDQRNSALNQVAILQAQLVAANKSHQELQAQCDALNAKINSEPRGLSTALTEKVNDVAEEYQRNKKRKANGKDPADQAVQ